MPACRKRQKTKPPPATAFSTPARNAAVTRPHPVPVDRCQSAMKIGHEIFIVECPGAGRASPVHTAETPARFTRKFCFCNHIGQVCSAMLPDAYPKLQRDFAFLSRLAMGKKSRPHPTAPALDQGVTASRVPEFCTKVNHAESDRDIFRASFARRLPTASSPTSPRPAVP